VLVGQLTHFSDARSKYGVGLAQEIQFNPPTA